MTNLDKPLHPVGYFLLSIFFILVLYAGFLSYKSIDWNVLKRLEQQPIYLPTPQTQPISSVTSTPSATGTSTP